MSLDDKLNQLRALLDERDAIDRQLEGIIGHYGTRPATTSPKPGAAQAPKAKPKQKAAKPVQKKETTDDATRNEDIMQALLRGEKPRHVAQEHGVSVQTVYNIKARSKTTHIKAQRATRLAQAEPQARPVSKLLDGFE